MTRKDLNKNFDDDLDDLDQRSISEGDDEIDEFPVEIDEDGWEE